MNLEIIAEKITVYVGTPVSIVLHLLVFIGWFVFKLDLNLLTNLVSLEAIFLALFIQMSVNKHQATSKRIHRKIIDMEQKITDNEFKR